MGLTSIIEKFLDMTERKMLVTTLCIAVLLFSLGGAAYLGVGVNLNFSYNETLNSHEYRIKVLTEWVGNLTEEQKWIIQQAIEMELNSSFYPIQKECSYLINKVGSYTPMQNGTTGKLDAYGTNASQIINWARGNLTSGRTWYEKIVIKGNFSITHPILMNDFTEFDLTQSNLTLANNADCSMFQNIDQTNGNAYMKIRGGFLDGNNPNNAGTSHGVWIENNNVNQGKGTFNATILDIEGTEIWGFDDDGIKVRANTNDRIDIINVKIAGYGHSSGKVGGVGINITQVSDFVIDHCWVYATKEALYLDRANGGRITNNYFGGGSGSTSESQVYLVALRTTIFSDNKVQDQTKNALRIGNSPYVGATFRESKLNKFDNLQIWCSSQVLTNNTYSGIIVEGDSGYNDFSNCFIGRKWQSGTFVTSFFKYGVEERDSANNNTYVNMRIDVGTQKFVIVGSNSRYRKESARIYLVVGSSKTETSATYTSITAVRAYYNPSIYQNVQSIIFEVYLRTTNASSIAYAQVYDQTNSLSITGSELFTSNTGFTRLVTSDLTTALGTSAKDLTVQLHTQYAYDTNTANLCFACLIVYKYL